MGLIEINKNIYKESKVKFQVLKHYGTVIKQKSRQRTKYMWYFSIDKDYISNHCVTSKLFNKLCQLGRHSKKVDFSYQIP